MSDTTQTTQSGGILAAKAAEDELIRSDIQAFLDQNEAKELCRFVTVGSVDDGKSTLIGRLLHDSKGVYDDQLADATRTSETGETAIDFARITDGLRAEREQGITIDVAYRYFSTPRRKFIIADTPGHVQYTRNMATGASTANVAIILIDARLGVLTQSRRHSFIADLLGIPHLLVCVNKMDLVDYGKERYDEILADFDAVAQTTRFTSITYVPISALMGVNVVDKNEARTPWYDGPTVLQFLERVEISKDINVQDFRYPVQYVIRPNLDYRGFAGQVVSGTIRKGDEVVALPSGKTSKVVGIDTFDGELEMAHPPLSVVLRLADEIDISRGDMICKIGNQAHVGRQFEADVVWMSETPMDVGKSYLIKLGTSYVRCNVETIQYRMDLDNIEQVAGVEELELNDIGRVRFTTHRPVCFDAYRKNRATGSFIIIDSLTNNTVGAAMIADPDEGEDFESDADISSRSQVSARERSRKLGHNGGVVWVAGSDDESRTRLAFALERRLFDLGNLPAVLDAADVRYEGVLSDHDAGLIAHRLADAGVLAVVSTPEVDAWAATQQHVGPDRFVLVRENGAGDADLEISFDNDDAVEKVIASLQERGWLARS
jgi:bifunctional enzyme CysN/CysC